MKLPYPFSGGWYEIRYWYFNRNRKKLGLWIIWKLPRWVVYWCAIRLIAHATTGKYGSQNVPKLTAMDALKRWDNS